MRGTLQTPNNAHPVTIMLVFGVQDMMNDVAAADHRSLPDDGTTALRLRNAMMDRYDNHHDHKNTTAIHYCCYYRYYYYS